MVSLTSCGDSGLSSQLMEGEHFQELRCWHHVPHLPPPVPPLAQREPTAPAANQQGLLKTNVSSAPSSSFCSRVRGGNPLSYSNYMDGWGQL